MTMDDRIERKHASRRGDERESACHDKMHRRHSESSSTCNKKNRHERHTHSRHADSSDSKSRSDHKSEAAEKAHQLGERSKTTSYVNTTTEGSSRPQASAHDVEFNWEAHRSTLDAIFFQDEDVIKKGSAEYDEFWVFLQKYQAFSRKQMEKSNSSLHLVFQSERFLLPEKYDKRYRVNVSLLSKDVKGLLSRKQRAATSLTEEKVATFRGIVLHYIDFLQKQKFARLVKVKRDQQNLPIYEHRQEIVDAVSKHQVVVVAGDTGCGKSTQVPQYLLAAGYTHIACTQPRRIACISLSRRVAYETLNEYGSQVAYQVYM